MSNTIVNTNVSAINSHRSILSVGRRLNRSSERLASGMRINRAADDAAGLALSEKMRNQIRGLDQAARNSHDGISLVQTAEGAMEEIHRILERTRELTNQAANDIYTDNDRANIHLEVNQLMSEINQITHTTEFNTMRLLGGANRTQEGVNNINAVQKHYNRIRDNLDRVLGEYADARDLYDRATTNLFTAEAELEAARNSDNETFDRAQVNLAAARAIHSFATDIRDVTRDIARLGSSGGVASDFAVVVSRLDNLITANTVADRFNQNLSGINFRTTFGAGISPSPTFPLAPGSANNPSDNLLTGGLFITGSGSLSLNDPAPPGGYDRSMNDVNAISRTNKNLISDITSLVNNSSAADNTASNLQANNINLSFIGNNPINEFSGSTDTDAVGHGVNRSAGLLDSMFRFDGGVTNSLGGSIIVEVHQGNFFPNYGTFTIGGNGVITQAGRDVLDKIIGSVGSNTIVVQDVNAVIPYNPSNQELLNGIATLMPGANLSLLGSPRGSGMVNISIVLGAMENAFSPALGLQIQSGANSGQRTDVRINTMDLSGLGLRSFAHQFEFALLHENSVPGGGRDLSASLNMLDNAVNTISTQRAELGAVQNRLEHTINNLRVSSENLSSSNSRIRDTDMAREMMALTQANVLQQAGMSMLAQANMAPQSVLQLLG